MKIFYRKCSKADLPQCAAVLREVYAAPPYNEPWNETKGLEYLKTFLRMGPEECLVAIEQEEIVGAIFAYRYPWHTGEILFVQELFVSRKHQGRGIGRHLMTLLGTKGQDPTVALIAREGTSAAAFYEKMGLLKSRQTVVRSGKIGA